jgi:hypothetical protein
VKRLILLAMASALSTVASAQVPAPHIWPVPGLYGLERSACGTEQDQASNGDTAMVAPAFCPALSLPARQQIGARFATAMAAHFPGVESSFAAGLPADATPRARLAASLVASLRLSRATIWRIDKQVGTDAFLPITLTLDITNPATGEVVFSRTRSQVAEGTAAAGSVDADLVAQFPAKLDEAMQALVASAAADWKPAAQTAAVVGKVGDSWVIDRGRAQGLRNDESIGEDGHISYAGANYALVRPALGSYTVGQTLSRTTVAPVEMLARPSVLTLLDGIPGGYSRPYLTTLFEQALGDHAELAPMPVDPSFVALRTMVLGDAQAPSDEPRSLPDYVAVVRVALLPSARIVSNIPGVTIERHDARAYVTFVDHAGRAVFAVEGVGRITDQVSGSTRFSTEQRNDTAIRNALINAATKLAAFRPQPLTLPIAKTGDHMLIADSGGSLPLDTQLVVLRDAGHFRDIDGLVRVPVGQVTTRVLSGDGIVADNADVTALNLHAGDVVAIEQVGPALQARTPVMQCLDPAGLPAVEDRGSVPAPFWSWAAADQFVLRFRAPVEIAGLSGELARFAPYFAGWDHFVPAHQPPTATCFVPVMAVVAAPVPRHGAGYALTAGYRLMQGQTRVGGGGMQDLLIPTAIPAGTDDANAAAMLQQDLADHLPPLADRAAAVLSPPTSSSQGDMK